MKYSFIVALYNAADYIEETLKSMLNQSFDDFEIILVNDGSVDKSVEVVSKYVDGKKVKLINQNNQGCGGARNTGIKASCGEYIVIVDADDLVEPDLLENLNTKNTDIIKYKVRCIEEEPNNRFELTTFNSMSGVDAVIEFCKTKNIWATPWGSAIKRSLFIDNDFFFESRRYHEDFGLIPRMYLKAETVSSIDYMGYNYIKRPNSITTKTDILTTFKRTRDFMYHFVKNKEYIIENCSLPINEKDIIVEYFTERFLLKLAKIDEREQNMMIGEVYNEPNNRKIKTK